MAFRWIAVSALLLLFVPGLQPAHAAETPRLFIAVLELRVDPSATQVTGFAANLLTGLLREEANRNLPATKFHIMTQENITDMLLPGKSLESCLDAKCEIEIGRTLNAHYIVTGDIGQFGGEVRVQLRVHEVREGRLLASETVGHREFLQIESELRKGATRLYNAVRLDARVDGVSSALPTKGAQLIVRFESEPPGATVLLNDEALCPATPCSKALSPGPYTVAMVREGYFRREEQVTVNEASAVSWVLKPRLGGLDIVARDTMGNDVTSRVFVDGKFVGTCPGVLQIVMGTHSVRVEAPTGFWVGEITVLENQVTRKSVDLTGVSVRLSSEPLGATMTINGKRYASPARAELPETGNYTVTAKYRGYPPQVRAAAISQYGEKTVHIDLTDKIYTALVMAEFTTNKGYHWSIYHLFHPFKDDVFCLGVRTAFGETYYDRVQSQGGHQNVEFLYMTYTAATAMLGILWRKDNDFLVGVLLEYGGFIPTHRFLKLTENTHVTDFQIEPHFGGFKTLIGGEARWGLNGGIVFGHTVFPPAKVKVTIHEAQDWPSGVNSFTVGGFLGWHW